MMREQMAKGLRGVHRAGALASSAARLAALKARFPGLRTEGHVHVGAGCDVYIAAGSEVLLSGTSIARDVTLHTAPGAVMRIAASHIGRGAFVVARELVVLEPGSGVGEYAVIRDAQHADGLRGGHGRYSTAPVHIGRDVWIGAQSTIMAGVTIGDDAIVGAGAVVTRDVAPGTTVVGVPARPTTADRGGLGRTGRDGRTPRTP